MMKSQSVARFFDTPALDRNTRLFFVKSLAFTAALFAVLLLFKFPVELFDISSLTINRATRIFSKRDALQVLALVGLFFYLYNRDAIAKVKHPRWRTGSAALYLTAGLIFVSLYYLLRYISNVEGIVAGSRLYAVQAASLITLFTASAFIALSAYSPGYLKGLYKALKKEIWTTAVLGIAVYNLLIVFQKQWHIFSKIISNFLYRVFGQFLPVSLGFRGPEPILEVSGFRVIIGPECSGIESLFLFAAFSVGLFAVDRHRIRAIPFLICSAIGAVGVFFINILRLFLLMLAGVYIDPDFAVGLFHTNAGWLLFVLYFILYYVIIKRFIYKDSLTGAG